MKKRILQFIPSFHLGGSERQAVALTRLLKGEGSFDVFAATLNEKGVLRSALEEVGFVEIPEFPLTSFYNTNFVRQVRRCAAYLNENKIDIVHTYDFYTNVFGMAAATLAGVPSKITSKRETAGVRSSRQEFVERLAFGRADAIVANSAAVSEYLLAGGIASNKIKVIYNGLDLARFDNAAPRREMLGLPTDESIRFVTLIANLRHSVKNVPMFLRVAKRVSSAVPDTHFVVAGEGELEAELQALAHELGIGHVVHFIGRCDDVPALLASSYAGVLTSTAEGFSNSILEYMTAGKPVVATSVGGAAEAVVEGETGYLVASDDDESMAGRVVELLNDSARAAAFGDAANRRAAQLFSQEEQLRNTIELYNSLLNR